MWYHMIMVSNEEIEYYRDLTASHGFTIEYQLSKESKENTVSQKNVTPATKEKYFHATSIWEL